MKKLPAMKNNKAVSPVVATVILVAVAITVSVSVGFWMGGIAGGYTNFEKVEISTAYSTKNTNGWTVSLELKNSGSAASTLNRAFINDIPLNQTSYGASGFTAGQVSTNLLYTGKTLTSGNSTTINLYISNTYSTLTSGTSVNIKLHSVNGMDYLKIIELV